MKNVPFYANHNDGMHCMLAVYGSIIEYFLGKRLSWRELEGLTGYKDKKAVWTIGTLPRLSTMGLDIKMIEPFDYRRYYKEGESYLKEVYNKQEISWYIKNSNILQIKDQIPYFLKTVDYECKQASLSDIDDLLDDGHLVFMTVNSKVLNKEEGFESHALLVLSKDKDNYVVHDPGPPPIENRIIGSTLLYKAMGGENNTAEVTGFKLKDKLVRADVILANMYPIYSRSALAKLFAEDKVKLSGKPIKTGSKILSSSELNVDISSLEAPLPSIELPVIYEDDNCIVINKPSGILTHAPGNFTNEPSVASFLRQEVDTLEGNRGGIVHRLDRATSGVLLCAKSPEALSFFQKQFAERKVIKTYVAAIEGHIKPLKAMIDMPIERNPKAPATFRVGANGKTAQTVYEVTESGNKNDLIELTPKTGRTHQLRVHLARQGHPILGDQLYGQKSSYSRLYLHAKSLEISMPDGTRHKFNAPVPKDFKEVL